MGAWRGHACWTGRTGGLAREGELDRACAAAHGCEVEDLAWVSALFTAADARGRGIGRLLLEAVVSDIRLAGRRPCLEVLPNHPAALSLYAATGWREVTRLRPEWLRQVAGDDDPDVIVMTLPSPRH